MVNSSDMGKWLALIDPQHSRQKRDNSLPHLSPFFLQSIRQLSCIRRTREKLTSYCHCFNSWIGDGHSRNLWSFYKRYHYKCFLEDYGKKIYKKSQTIWQKWILEKLHCCHKHTTACLLFQPTNHDYTKITSLTKRCCLSTSIDAHNHDHSWFPSTEKQVLNLSSVY